MSSRNTAWIVLVSSVTFVGLWAAEPTDPELTEAEKVLKNARIEVDAAALLKFFRERTLSDVDQVKLAAQIRQLGDESFEMREKASAELTRAGRVAVALLKEAVNNPDLEIARRAERCLEEIAANPDLTLAPAAAKLLAAKKPDGTLEVLLAYLPWAGDEGVETAIFEALLKAGLKKGKADALLVKALSDKHPLRRAAAVYVVGQAEEAQAKLVARLLSDADLKVRFAAASAQTRAGNKAAVPVLTALLSEAPFPIASQSEELLFRIAGEQSPATALAPDEQTRRKTRAAWEEWWKANSAKIDLAKVKLDEVLQGLTVACNCDYKGKQGRVWEFRNDGKTRWQIDNDMNCASDAQVLPGGKVLIAEYQGQRVTERDRDGKILWSHKVTRAATTCQRLPNGNTFIATYSEILEVTRDNKIAYNYPSRAGWGDIYRSVKMRNGHILFLCSGNKVIELDTAGKEVRTIGLPAGHNATPYGGVEPLSNGRYLVALYGMNKVLEIDAAGKIQWELSVRTPSSASRLPNGHTLVSSMDAQLVIEFDRAGKEVWKQATEGRPFRVRRY